MQSTQMPKIQQEIDPHDVLAIEQALAAHAHRAPPLVHDPAAPPAAPQAEVVQAPVVQNQAAPEISIDTPSLQVDAARRAAASSEMQLDDVRPGDLKAPGDRPSAKWTKGVLMSALGLCGAIAAAGWQHYGDQAKATALGWAPPFVISALDSSEKPTTAAQEGAPVVQAAADQATAQPAPPAEAAQSAAAAPAATTADAAQLQSMAQDLAAMSQQVEELKATVAQLKASQAQLLAARNSEVKTSEAKVSEARPLDQSLRPKLTTVAAPSPARPVAAPVRKPKPPAYPPAQAAYIPSPPVAAAAPPPPAPPPPAIADDGQPVVRPPMPLR